MSERQLHPGIQRTLSAGDAVDLYLSEYSGANVAPSFYSWWYWHETRVFDENENTICVHPHDENWIGFEQWVRVRKIPTGIICR